MKKYLKDIKRGIDILENGKKIKGFSFPLESIRELQTVYDELQRNGQATTINETVYRFIMYCGLKTQTSGIGWKIYAVPSIGK
jgi:hypothetical protein